MSGEGAPAHRSAVMIVVDAWWEGRFGKLQKGRGQIVNKSLTGACLRVKAEIEVGARVRVQSRWEEFCGITKYCRSDGNGYLVGIQRKTGTDTIPKQEVLENGTLQKVAGPGDEHAADGRTGRRIHDEYPWDEIAVARPTPDNSAQENNAAAESAIVEIVIDAGSMGRGAALGNIDLGKSPGQGQRDIGKYEGFVDPRWREVRTAKSFAGANQKRGSIAMERTWMGLGKRSNKTESSNESVNAGADGAASAEPRAAAGEPRTAAESAGALHSELLPLEEIYLAAGILNPRRGYNIKKVVEMLHSEHLRGLSKELRRASVLMALDAAGIPLDEVLRDAEARLKAADGYEAEQRRLREGEWARKAEEHVQIQSELEDMKARFAERLKQNEDSVARERARFATWATLKREESQSIMEAAELCAKTPEAAAEPAKAAPAGTRAAESTVKVV
jgi:hypothetical protein